jgi:phage tail P2-like protein
MAKIIASGVRNIKHIADFDELIEKRMAGIDLDALFVYLLDIVKEPALIHLAWQFDVLGFKGWALTQTEQDRRQLLKNAIELHKHKGTAFAIRRAISQAVTGIAYNDVIVQERVNLGGIFRNGLYNRNGSRYHGQTHWTNFRVLIDVQNFGPVTVDIAYLILQLILEYKNERSHLLNLSFGFNLVEEVDFSEEFLINVGEDFPEDLMFSILHDGENLRDGSRQRQQDIFNMTVITMPPTFTVVGPVTVPAFGSYIVEINIPAFSLPSPLVPGQFTRIKFSVDCPDTNQMSIIAFDPSLSMALDVIQTSTYGLSGANFVDTALTYGNVILMSTGSAPYTGDFDPTFGGINAGLDTWVGLDPNGTWYVVISNNAGTDGVFNSMEFQFQ